MDWQTVGKAVAGVAPVLGAVLGGPLGMVAEAAGSLVASVLGVEPVPATLLQQVRDPQVIARLKELEVRERERLLLWQEQQLAALLENTKDARAREVALARAGHGGAWVTGMVALIVVVGFFGMLALVMEQPAINEPALLLLGSLGTAFGSVVNYYLGSSLGSYSKNHILGSALPSGSIRGNK